MCERVWLGGKGGVLVAGCHYCHNHLLPRAHDGGVACSLPKILPPRPLWCQNTAPSPLNVKNRTPSHSQSSKYCMGGSCYVKIKVSQDPKEPKMTMGVPEYNSIYALLLLSNLDDGGSNRFWMISSSPNHVEPFFSQTRVGLRIYYQSLVELVRTMPNRTN